MLTGFGAETGVGGGVALGAGHKTSPWWVTIDRPTTSSSRLILNRPPSPIDNRNLVMLLEYNVLDWVGSREGRSCFISFWQYCNGFVNSSRYTQ
jgi:hypothetical protein